MVGVRSGLEKNRASVGVTRPSGAVNLAAGFTIQIIGNVVIVGVLHDILRFGTRRKCRELLDAIENTALTVLGVFDLGIEIDPKAAHHSRLQRAPGGS
jgi:hypothetical protein